MENSGVYHMLKFNKCDDLATMYKLFEHIPDGHLTIADCMSSYLREQGRGIVTANMDEDRNSIIYVQVIYYRESSNLSLFIETHISNAICRKSQLYNFSSYCSWI